MDPEIWFHTLHFGLFTMPFWLFIVITMVVSGVVTFVTVYCLARSLV